MNLYGFITEMERLGLRTTVGTTIDHHVNYKTRDGALTLFIWWSADGGSGDHLASLPFEPETSDLYEAARSIDDFFRTKVETRWLSDQAKAHLKSINDKPFELKSRLKAQLEREQNGI
jgi:hypothetical protein